jgi:hypothetical protein
LGLLASSSPIWPRQKAVHGLKSDGIDDRERGGNNQELHNDHKGA